MDLLVRGICSLRPGIPGVSENIRVRSIIGRFLEHSRIYWFLNGGHEEMYIGSADLMERNLDRRIETLTPIQDEEILEHLRDVVLGSYVRDTDRAWVLDSAGRYSRPEGDAPFTSQQFLLQQYSDTQTE
jgi:polyphosphate kinase